MSKQLFIHNKLKNVWFTLFSLHIYRKACLHKTIDIPAGSSCPVIDEKDVVQLMERLSELQGSREEGVYLMPPETITLYRIVDFAALCMVSEHSEAFKDELITFYALEQKNMMAYLDVFFQYADSLIKLVNKEFSDSPPYAALFSKEES